MQLGMQLGFWSEVVGVRVCGLGPTVFGSNKREAGIERVGGTYVGNLQL